MRAADQPPWTRERRQTIGRRVQDARRDAGLSQEQLAEPLEVDRRTIQHWEAGSSDPSLGHLLMLADVLNVRLADLVQ